MFELLPVPRGARSLRFRTRPVMVRSSPRSNGKSFQSIILDSSRCRRLHISSGGDRRGRRSAEGPACTSDHGQPLFHQTLAGLKRLQQLVTRQVEVDRRYRDIVTDQCIAVTAGFGIMGTRIAGNPVIGATARTELLFHEILVGPEPLFGDHDAFNVTQRNIGNVDVEDGGCLDQIGIERRLGQYLHEHRRRRLEMVRLHTMLHIQTESDGRMPLAKSFEGGTDGPTVENVHPDVRSRIAPSVREWLEPLWLPSGATTVTSYVAASAAPTALIPLAKIPSSLVSRIRMRRAFLVAFMSAPQNSYVTPFFNAIVSLMYPFSASGALECIGTRTLGSARTTRSLMSSSLACPGVAMR